jgi:ribonuclease P protein component
VGLSTLKRRAEFQRVRGGGRWAASSFVLEGKARQASASDPNPRFGFTVTKKLGGAVVRNRIRRRLKAAVAEVVQSCADPYFDYVVVARDAALDQSFELLKAELKTAFQRVHGRSPARATSTRERKNVSSD